MNCWSHIDDTRPGNHKLHPLVAIHFRGVHELTECICLEGEVEGPPPVNYAVGLDVFYGVCCDGKIMQLVDRTGQNNLLQLM